MKYLACLFALLMMPVAGADESVKQVTEAFNSGSLMPQFGDKLNTEAAYQLQAQVVQNLLEGKQPDGFKAGLTSKAAQGRFAVNQPVAGVLLADSRVTPDADGSYLIEARPDAKPMLELELGFQLKETVTRPISDVATLKVLVKNIYPVIELPELGFQRMPELLGTDIIANNVAARKYIVAERPASFSADINLMPVKLYRNKALILEGVGSDAMGDQWQALGWLINQTLANGWVISPDQILITGALGKMLPVEEGKYRADFAELGSIEWQVELGSAKK